MLTRRLVGNFNWDLFTYITFFWYFQSVPVGSFRGERRPRGRSTTHYASNKVGSARVNGSTEANKI